MYYDLNIPRPVSNIPNVLKDITERLIKYGYKGFAVTTNVDEDLLEKPKQEKDKKKVLSKGDSAIPLPVDLSELRKSYPKLCLYNRINIRFSNAGNLRKFLQIKELKKYDLMSFEPQNQIALKSLIGVSDVDILSYNAENKCDLSFNRKLYHQFVNQNVYFELTYSPGIIDSSARKHLFILSHIYKSVGKSKNIIVTSAAEKSHLIRGMYDVINLNLLFGLSEEQSKNALSKNCEHVLLRARRQRHSKATVEMEDVVNNLSQT